MSAYKQLKSEYDKLLQKYSDAKNRVFHLEKELGIESYKDYLRLVKKLVEERPEWKRPKRKPTTKGGK